MLNPEINSLSINAIVNPKKMVVVATSERVVVMMRPLWGSDLSSLNTRPKGIAPLIMPPHVINTSSYQLSLNLFPTISLINIPMPTVAKNLPTITIDVKVTNNPVDHLKLAYEKNESPK